MSQGIDITNWLTQEQEKADAERARNQVTRGGDDYKRAPEEQLAFDAAAFMREQIASPTVGESTLTETQALIVEVCDEYREFLLTKNRQYGDSAIHPVRIFSKASDEEQLLVRIDDKFSRLIRGTDEIELDEDIMDDLVGYWLLLKVLRRKAERDDS